MAKHSRLDAERHVEGVAAVLFPRPPERSPEQKPPVNGGGDMAGWLLGGGDDRLPSLTLALYR